MIFMFWSSFSLSILAAFLSFSFSSFSSSFFSCSFFSCSFFSFSSCSCSCSFFAFFSYLPDLLLFFFIVYLLLDFLLSPRPAAMSLPTAPPAAVSAVTARAREVTLEDFLASTVTQLSQVKTISISNYRPRFDTDPLRLPDFRNIEAVSVKNCRLTCLAQLQLQPGNSVKAAVTKLDLSCNDLKLVALEELAMMFPALKELSADLNRHLGKIDGGKFKKGRMLPGKSPIFGHFFLRGLFLLFYSSSSSSSFLPPYTFQSSRNSGVAAFVHILPLQGTLFWCGDIVWNCSPGPTATLQGLGGYCYTQPFFFNSILCRSKVPLLCKICMRAAPPLAFFFFLSSHCSVCLDLARSLHSLTLSLRLLLLSLWIPPPPFAPNMTPVFQLSSLVLTPRLFLLFLFCCYCKSVPGEAFTEWH